MEFQAQNYSQQKGSKALIFHKNIINVRAQKQKHVSWVSNHIPWVGNGWNQSHP